MEEEASSEATDATEATASTIGGGSSSALLLDYALGERTALRRVAELTGELSLERRRLTAERQARRLLQTELRLATLRQVQAQQREEEEEEEEESDDDESTQTKDQTLQEPQTDTSGEQEAKALIDAENTRLKIARPSPSLTTSFGHLAVVSFAWFLSNVLH